MMRKCPHVGRDNEHLPPRQPTMWTLVGHHEDRTPTHGYAATRQAAMTAFRKKLAAGVNALFTKKPRAAWAKRG
jgi:hypothetical protein